MITQTTARVIRPLLLSPAWVGIALIMLTLPAAFRSRGQAAPNTWDQYQVIMWVGDTAYKVPEKIPLFFQRLKEMNVSAITMSPGSDPSLAVTNGLRFYVENVVNRGLCLKWNSHVSDWDRFVTEWAKQGRPANSLVREYSLEDPAWQRYAKKEMEIAVRAARSSDPLLYNIRDELSVTISANPFDYDFSPSTLNAFREWLRTQYPSIEELNREWETHFNSWPEVIPFTTDQIKNRMASGLAIPRGNPDWQSVQEVRFDPNSAAKARTSWNFSPWADFRTFMDKSLSDNLQALSAAAHALDPRALAGIEGTQMPSTWGGYDLWRLSRALDWVEPYDIGNARAIFGSFMGEKPILTTVFEKETRMARRRLWHLLLEGDKGCLIWWSEDCIDWRNPEYPLTAKALALAPVLKELQSPLAKVFLRARREYDPIAIHYSQPSIQVDWLLESTVDGSTWLRRFSSFEADHNRMLRVRESWLKAFEDLGFTPKFISSEQIENGALQREYRALILPQSLALSDKESTEIKTFLESKNHRVFADGQPGAFDRHGKLRDRSTPSQIFPAVNSNEKSSVAGSASQATTRDGDISEYASDRIHGSLGWAKWIESNLGGIKTPVVVPLDARIRVHRYSLGRARLIALERNISYHMSEDLKQAGGNQTLETPVDITITIKNPGHAYDLSTGRYLGKDGSIQVHIDPWQPTLLAVLDRKIDQEPVSFLNALPTASNKDSNED